MRIGKVRCSKCDELKELNDDNFYKDRARKTGYKVECKECSVRIANKFIYKCTFCGEGFRSRKKHTENKFCSRKCSSEFQKTITGEDSPHYKGWERKRICPVCNKEYIEHRKGATKTCGRECANKINQKRVDIKCSNCSIVFEKRESEVYWHEERGRDLHFCSRKCKDDYYSGSNSPNWIKDRGKIKNKKHSLRFNSEMNNWRKQVYIRDDYTCQSCGAVSGQGNRVVLNAHHIKRFNDYPKLRTDINNGITLCESCHKETYCKEEQFEEEFSEVVRRKSKGDNNKQENSK